jgi:DNA invertase Pin-like site-specific DNA recombinase
MRSCGSGKAALTALLASLKPGDTLVVTRLDRLARSTIDLLTILKGIADHKASFQSLGEQWADTTTAAGRLMLTILGGLAEFERELIKARTAEGRERAKGRGVRMGRKRKLTPRQQEEIRRRKAEGQSVRELGRSYNVSPNTISRIR